MPHSRTCDEQTVEEEIAGLRHGLICTIALLVALLEERGMLEPGLYKTSLCEALRHLENDRTTPQGRVLSDFVRTLGDSEANHNYM